MTARGLPAPARPPCSSQAFMSVGLRLFLIVWVSMSGYMVGMHTPSLRVSTTPGFLARTSTPSHLPSTVTAPIDIPVVTPSEQLPNTVNNPVAENTRRVEAIPQPAQPASNSQSSLLPSQQKPADAPNALAATLFPELSTGINSSSMDGLFATVSHEWETRSFPTASNKLQQMEFSKEYKVRIAGNSSASHSVELQIDFGPWRMKYPRFLRPHHALWWSAYDVTTWRTNAHCPGDKEHPVMSFIKEQIPGLVAFPSDLRIAEAVGREHNDAFTNPMRHQGWYEFCEPAYTTGSVTFAFDTMVMHPGFHKHACGQSDNFDAFWAHGQSMLKADIQPSRGFSNLFWAYVEASGFVQHAFQNVMPKIAQAILVDGSLSRGQQGEGEQWVSSQQLLLDRFPLVGRLFDYMGWDPPVDLEFDVPQHANKLAYACKSPPLHPILWQVAQQQLLNVKPATAPRYKIAYCGRTTTGSIENVGRRVLNERELLLLLAQWGAKEGEQPRYKLVEFDHRQYTTVEQLVEFWSDVHVLIGPHGGCLTNVWFMPANAVVIELFPLVMGSYAPLRSAGMMFYMQSTLLDHQYWMLPIVSTEVNGDFNAPMLDVCSLMVSAVGKPPNHPHFSCVT